MWVMSMNRLLYVLLITAITIIGFTMYRQHDIGQISLQFADFSFQTNLIVFSAALLSSLFVILLILKSIQAVKNFYLSLTLRREQRQQEKARAALSQGLIAYADGQFERSEKILLQQVKYSDNLLPVYLTAARAAQQLGAHERRDEYLNKAHETMPEADIAIRLTKAELQLAHNQNEQALATLTQLYQLKPEHAYVLMLLANTYLHLQDWDKLADLLPQLKKHSQFSADSLLSFETDACKGQLSNLAKSADASSLIDFWNDTAKHLKASADIVEHYVKQLLLVDTDGEAAAEAENVLRQFINKNWHESSIMLYSELDVTVEKKQLEMVESWLDEHQNNAYLLLALGKNCINRSLWGKARNYLEASIAIEPLPETYLKLARLLEKHMNEPETAQKYYRQGLYLLAGEHSEEILVDDETPAYLQESPQLKIVKS